MICRKCQFENPEGAKLCHECGSKLELACPQCGKVNPTGSKFCNECGNDIVIPLVTKEIRDTSAPSQQVPTRSEPVSLGEGERRRATTVFSDLSGYTTMNEKLDPEEVEERIRTRLRMHSGISTGLVVTHI